MTGTGSLGEPQIGDFVTVQSARPGGLGAWGRGRCPQSSRMSLDVQDVGLFQPEAGLVPVKEALQRLHVHLVVEVHHLLRRILDLRHRDRLSH